MFPLSVMRFKLELMPCFAGWTKQKLPTTSTIQNSLSPVAAYMIFSVVRQLDQSSVFELRADRDDVLGVILHRPRRILRKRTDG